MGKKINVSENKKIYLDKKGYEEYLNQIDAIREKIKQNSTNITEYQSSDAYGDGWHDNFAYEQAIKKENTLFYELESKLKELNNIIIIDDDFDNKNQVGIYSIVDIKFEDEDEIETYNITGGVTSKIDDKANYITLNSPLGKAIYKKKVGDSFSYKIDSLELKGNIIDIR